MTDDNAQPAPPPVQMVSIGEALINPPWQGNLICLSDNGGDLIMLSFTTPTGIVRCLYPRGQGAAIRDWLTIALQAPVLTHPAPQPQPAIEGEPAGTAN
jgi:hypothetical protein